jgi:hypothetical protein
MSKRTLIFDETHDWNPILLDLHRLLRMQIKDAESFPRDLIVEAPVGKPTNVRGLGYDQETV